MCTRLKNFLSESSSGIKLSYLTLSIENKQVQKDFEVHQIAQQHKIALFWIAQVLVTMNLLT
jgi:hypothetical protein